MAASTIDTAKISSQVNQLLLTHFIYGWSAVDSLTVPLFAKMSQKEYLFFRSLWIERCNRFSNGIKNLN